MATSNEGSARMAQGFGRRSSDEGAASRAIAWRAEAETWRFTYVSPEAEELLGFPVQRWLDEPSFWQDHIHADDRDWALSHCRRSSASLRPYEFEYRMIAQDGRVVRLWDAVQVVAENGRPKELVGVMVDVTERRRREEERREQADLWEAMLAGAPEFFITVSLDGTILFINRVVPGLEREKVLEASLYDYLPLSEVGRVKEALDRAVRTGEAVYYEVSGAGPHGTTAWYSSRVAPVKKDGRVVSLTILARDITQSRLAEDHWKERERAYETFIGSLPEMTFRIRRDGTFAGFKGTETEPPATPPERFLGKKVQDVLPPSLAARILHSMDRAFVTREAQILEYALPVPLVNGPLALYEARITALSQEEVLAIVRRSFPFENARPART